MSAGMRLTSNSKIKSRYSVKIQLFILFQFHNSDICKRLIRENGRNMNVHDEFRFRVGTLVYSRAGLVTLFAWLLWGDFVYTLMENVMPSLLPMVLRDNGASNQAIAFIVSSIYMVVNAVANPIISYKSDRFRSRWGAVGRSFW